MTEGRGTFHRRMDVTSVDDYSGFDSPMLSPITRSRNFSTSMSEPRSRSRFRDHSRLWEQTAKQEFRLKDLKREITTIRSLFADSFAQFTKCLKESKEKAMEYATQSISVKDVRTHHVSLAYGSQRELMRERELRIVELEQEVMTLNQQLRFAKPEGKSSTIIRLESELEEKTRALNDIEAQTSMELAQLRRKIEEQNVTIKDYKNKRFQIVQLQTELDEKNRLIKKLREDCSNLTSELQSQMQECENTNDDLKFTVTTMANLESEKKLLEEESKSLKFQIDQMERENRSESTKRREMLEENERLGNELKTLKSQLASKESGIEKMTEEIDSLKEAVEERDRLIESKNNELSVLEFERSMAASSRSYSVPTSPSKTSESPLDKNTEKVKADNIALKERVKVKEMENIELSNIIATLKLSISQSEDEKQLMSEQIQRVHNVCERRNNRIETLKAEIERLKKMVREKDNMINEVMNAQEMRSKELERLHSSIDELSLSALNESSSSSVTSDLMTKFNTISKDLCESKGHVNNLSALTKKQSAEIGDLKKSLQDHSEKLVTAEKLVDQLMRENEELKSQNRTIVDQTSTTVDTANNELENLQKQYESIAKSKIELERKVSELTQQISDKDNKLQELRATNTLLQEENFNISTQYSTELKPLEEENARLQEAIERLRETDKLMASTNSSLFVKTEELRQSTEMNSQKMRESIAKHKEKITSLKKQLDETKMQKDKAEDIIRRVMDQLDCENSDDIQQLIGGLKTERIKLKKDLSSKTTELESLTGKKDKLDDRVKAQTQRIEDQTETIDRLTKELYKTSEALESAKARNSELEEQFEIATEEKESLESHTSCLEKQLVSIEELLQASSQDDLINQIRDLIDSNEESAITIKDLEAAVQRAENEAKQHASAVQKLGDENRGQAELIERLHKRIDDQISMSVDQSSSMTDVITELRGQLEETEHRNQVLESEFDRFREIVCFVNVTDLFMKVSNLIEEKKYEAKQLQFQIQQTEAHNKAIVDDLKGKNERLQKQAAVIPSLMQDKQKLETRVREMEQQCSEMKIHVATAEATDKIAISKFDEITSSIADITECEAPEDILASLCKIKAELQTKSERITELQNETEVKVREIVALKDEIQTLKTEIITTRHEHDVKDLDSRRKETADMLHFGVNNIEELKSKYDALQTSTEELTTELKNSEFEKQKLGEQLKASKSAMDNLKIEKASLADANATLVKKFTDLEDCCRELKEQNVVATNNIEKVISENKEMKKLLRKSTQDNQALASKAQTLTSENFSLASQVRNLTATNERLEAENSGLLSANQELKSQNNSQNSENSTLFEQIGQFETMNRALKTENEKVKTEIDSLSKMNIEITEKYRDVMAKNVTLAAQVDSMTTEMTVLASQNETLTANLEASMESAEKNDIALMELRQQHDELTAEANMLRQKTDHQTSQISNLISQNKSLYAEAQKLEALTNEQTIENRKLTSRTTAIESQLKRVTTELEEIKNDKEENSDERTRLIEENASLQDSVKSLSSQTEMLLSESRKVSQECEMLNKENDQLKSDIKTLRNKVIAMESESRKLIAQNASLMTENAELSGENKSLTQDNKLLIAKNSTLSIQQASLSDANEALHTQNAQLVTENSALQTERSTLNLRVSSLQGQIAKLEEKLEGQNVVVEALKTKNQKLVGDLQVERANVRSLNTSNNELTKRNQTLNEQYESLSSENRNLRMELSESGVKIQELETQTENLVLERKSSQEVIIQLEQKQISESQRIASMKKKLRESRRQIAELESAKLSLIGQANQLDLLKEELQAGGVDSTKGESVVEQVSTLLKQNIELQVIMEESQKANDAYHIETDRTIKQCNLIIHKIFDILSEVNLPELHMPLTPDEVALIDDSLMKFQVAYSKHNRSIERILTEASLIGYTERDIDGAVQYISHKLSSADQSSEIEELRRTITDITSTSDKRKRASKEYLEKLRRKLQKQHTKNNLLRNVITELVNMTVGESYDGNLLLEQLNEEELSALGLQK